jgi:hypothetical protein
MTKSPCNVLLLLTNVARRDEGHLPEVGAGGAPGGGAADHALTRSITTEAGRQIVLQTGECCWA